MTKTYLITPGELNGIGLEISLKALKNLNEGKILKDSYIIFLKEDLLKEHLKKIPLPFKLEKLTKPQAKLPAGVYYINAPAEPVDWFKEACDFCSKNSDSCALITGPLVKASFNDPLILGHTEYLRSQFKTSDLFMTFFGEHYNCLLLNDHIPLKETSKNVSTEKIISALNILKKVFKKPKLALLGLNPHAGEGGLIGNEECEIHQKICNQFSDISGPLSPDGFFTLEAYKKYDFLIANYHDQGLIPFKLINGFNASQASLGLPFIRTSVNHGTSNDLFMKFTANPDSMVHAIQLAQHLLHLKNFGEK